MNPNKLPKAWTNELIAAIPGIIKAVDRSKGMNGKGGK
jgi:hypothetical protein